jgi:hypothetical protein
MLSCKEVVKIISSDNKKSWRRRIEIRMHLFMCQHCSKYAKQLEYMTTGFKKLIGEKNKDSNSAEIKKIEKDVIRKVKLL